MKILAFTNLFPRAWEPYRATFNQQQFTKIAEHFQIEVLVPVAWTDILMAWKAKKFSMRSREWNAVRATYFPYFFIPRFARWSYGITLFFSSILVMPQLMGSKRPDLIFASWAYPDGFAAMCLGRLFNIPVLVKVHGSDINEQPKIMGVAKQVSWVLSHAKAIVSVSKDLAKKVIALGAEKDRVKVVYNGVDTSLFQPLEQQKCRSQLSFDKNTKIILYVGNLKTTKGCLDLLDAFAMFKQKERSVQLVYIGSGPCEQMIQTQIEMLNLQGSVHLIGTQKHQTLPVWMGAADLIVLASHAEGVPNVLLEAMACGRPVVATKVGGIPEIVKDECGILVAPHDTTLLFRAIDNALQRSWSSDAIVTYVSQYTWKKNVQSVLALCLDV